ncbi:MAG: ATP synthase F1 subunit delta [Patescibacteria group bacterium]
MKISVLQYAQSLYDSVEGKSEKEIKVILKNFVSLLGDSRELNRATEIIRVFNELWNKENGELAASLTSARELDKVSKEMVMNYLKEKTGASKIILNEEIDKKLIGGFVLRYNSRVVDASLKTSLEDLKNKISR